MNQSPHWIFGYGSLIWRPSFSYWERRPAWIQGWTRRFWQGSTDHRGVPDAPGRVATLLPEAAATCWGMAYRIGQESAPPILSRLDLREQGGYQRSEVTLHFSDGAAGESAIGLMYVATPRNPNYLGPAPLDEVAAQVRRSSGPSGHNIDYVLRLAEAMRQMQAVDEHVFELERRVIELEGDA